MFRLATTMLSPGGARGRLSAFIFHRVLAEPDPLMPSEPHAEQFDRMLGWIGAQFDVLPPVEACERLYSHSLPPRAAVITFDDGYRDNHDLALPLLRKHRMPAAFFIATGYLNGGVMFNDRVTGAIGGAGEAEIDLDAIDLGTQRVASVAERRALIERVLGKIKHLPPQQRLTATSRIEDACGASAPRDLMMDDAHVRALLDAGMAIGGHTRTHPILAVLEAEAAQREITEGREDLRAILGEAPLLFAYPNGRVGDDFDARHLPMVAAAGYSHAFSTEPGVASASSHAYCLPRHTPWARSWPRFQCQALANLNGRDAPAGLEAALQAAPVNHS